MLIFIFDISLYFSCNYFYESLGVNSLLINMTLENPISRYCEIKVIIIIIIIIMIIIIKGFTRSKQMSVSADVKSFTLLKIGSAS